MGEASDNLRLKLSPIEAGKYLIGLSGGADSVALVTMLIPDMRSGKIRLMAVHVNHGLRAEASDEDERFCTALCKKEGIPLVTFRADLAGRTDEDSARKARYAAFRAQYEAYGADALILAHHADDQAETFLMRLLRGAGTEGLACMKADAEAEGMRILRPMLSIRRDEIRDALRKDGISWREDESNLDTAYLRNRIRQELIPAMEQISGTAVRKISEAARLTDEDNRVLNELALDITGRVADGPVLDAEALQTEPEALQKRVLRIWWQENAPALPEHTLSTAQTEALRGLLDIQRGKINLPGETHAVRSGRYLFLKLPGTAIPEPVTVTGPETVFGSFRLTASASEGNPGDGRHAQEVPQGFARGCVIRTRQPGDRIRPFGSSGSRKLQDYLTDRKIPEPFRDMIPLLCRDQEVLLVCGVGAGDIPGWNPDTPTERLTWHGKTPWSAHTGERE